MNNLQKRNIFIVEWCCMCKNNWESADHLLLQCDYAQVYGVLLFVCSPLGYAQVDGGFAGLLEGGI